eukprot:NODE_328_length_10919_cov_0.472828.p9 type:complete len:122 gc:universal NODE_328_length_10919_cov_0.472828:4457-4092(-)
MNLIVHVNFQWWHSVVIEAVAPKLHQNNLAISFTAVTSSCIGFLSVIFLNLPGFFFGTALDTNNYRHYATLIAMVMTNVNLSPIVLFLTALDTKVVHWQWVFKLFIYFDQVNTQLRCRGRS